MNDRNASRTPSSHHGPGIKLVLLALLLVAIATAVDIAWMKPGRATTSARGEHAAVPSQQATSDTEAKALALGRIPTAHQAPAGPEESSNKAF